MVTTCTASLTFSNSTFCPYSVFLNRGWFWEQIVIISLYSINWWFFYVRYLTVYSLMVIICTISLTIKNSTFCPHNVFVCFVWVSEQTAIISPTGLYNWDGVCLLRDMDWVFKYNSSESWAWTAMPCLSRPGFYPSSVLLRFTMDRAAMSQVFISGYFGFALSVAFIHLSPKLNNLSNGGHR